jgi:uncharacterized protein involved in outer membrane biogenesis
MKKWMLILGGLAALGIGAAAALLVSINPIVEAGVNMYGPDITGTHVFLKKADISVFSGKGSLHEFTLGNPKGYRAPHAVKVASVSMELDKDSLLDDVIVIRRIDIDSPDIIYEISGKSNNFDDILKNVRSLTAAEEKAARAKDAPASKDGGKARKVVIDELTIRNAKAAVSLPSLKLDLSTPLPDIRLTDIGRDKSGRNVGVSMAEAASRVLKAVSGSLGSASKEAVSKARVSLTIGSEGLGKTAKNVGDAIKGLFRK